MLQEIFWLPVTLINSYSFFSFYLGFGILGWLLSLVLFIVSIVRQVRGDEKHVAVSLLVLLGYFPLVIAEVYAGGLYLEYCTLFFLVYGAVGIVALKELRRTIRIKMIYCLPLLNVVSTWMLFLGGEMVAMI